MAEMCPVTHPLIEGGASCRYLEGHAAAGIPHTTENGTWWRDDPETDVSSRPTDGAPVKSSD